MPLSAQPHIAIVGAGLAGRLLAWRLVRQGHQITLFEAAHFDMPVSAAHTAAAMISPMSEVVVSERAIFDMGLRSLSLWPVWLEELQLDAPKVEYSAKGSVVVAHAHDLSELDQFYSDLNYHLGTDNNARWLTAADLRQLEPDLSHQFDTGLYLPGEAYLDNRQLLKSLLHAIGTLGGHCVEQQPFSLSGDQQDEEILSAFDLCIDCRGLGAKGINHKLRGVRGEVLWVETEEIQFHHPIRLMHPRYKLYVVPKPQNRMIIGATEIESEDRSPVSVQSMLELGSALYTLNPAFAEARIIELDANLRPAYLDNLPSIQMSELRLRERNIPLLSINGLYRHGYLLAPTLVDDALTQLANLPTELTRAAAPL